MRLGHLLGQRRELGVALAGEQRHRHLQPRQLLPERRQRPGAEPAQRGGEAVRGAPQAVLVRSRGDVGRDVGEDRRLRPLPRELVDRQRLDLLGQPLIGDPSLLALGVVGQPRAGADQQQPRHAVRQRERDVQRDPAAL